MFGIGHMAIVFWFVIGIACGYGLGRWDEQRRMKRHIEAVQRLAEGTEYDLNKENKP